jgi:hypothetical protein
MYMKGMMDDSMNYVYKLARAVVYRLGFCVAIDLFTKVCAFDWLSNIRFPQAQSHVSSEFS